MRTVVLFTIAALACAEDFRQSEFTPHPAGWSTWAQRPEVAPRTFVDTRFSRGGPGALAISGASNSAEHGGWEHSVAVEPGKWYRLTAFYRAEGITFERGQVLARLDWYDRAGERAGQPEFLWRTTNDGDWRRVAGEAPAPEKAVSVKIQLYLSNAPQATVWWDDISFEAIPAPPPRPVTIASINFRPRNVERPVDAFVEVVGKTVRQKTDLIVLPEGITVVGTKKKYTDVAEPVPGPTTQVLGELARKHDSWIAAGIYERDGVAVYNTSVLLDRQGRLAGKYRKVYIPREEIEGGITPGIDYPVFQTDFGRIGMMICYDVFYTDPARALALQGAEIIAMPIWGGKETLAKARAVENHVFLATSGYDYPTHIIDPVGEILAAAPENGSAAITTVDLNKRYDEPYLGVMRGRFMKEVRLDVPVVH